MKHYIFQTILLLLVNSVHSQGFLYDQQSSTDETPISGAGAVIQQLAPYGQSFTPSLSSVDFIRLNLNDGNPNNGIGATIYLNLRTNTINGAILATTPSISLTNGFAGIVNFLFPSTVPLTPSATYVFEIVMQSGSDSWNALAGEYNYSGGIVYANGVPASGSDLWFREGIVTVPEPSSAVLVLLGSGAWLFIRRFTK